MIEVKRDCDGTCACAIEPLAHPKYSFGMLLEPRLLELEHRYHTMRANTHDIRLHDFGTVCGLRVVKHPSPQCKYVILQAGLALDCCGREIVVPEPLFVPLEDGATSGWCGATMAATPAPAPALNPAPGQAVATPAAVAEQKLYVCLRYAQCDTDPIPTYVRRCGCCGPCEHGDCTPSVTREGYEVLVTSTPPPSWVNPIGKAFCEWLDVKLSGPGQSAPAQTLHGKTLEEVLCEVVTDPCADFCAHGNETLLLATVTVNADGVTAGIDNVTGRRLVISTGAIIEALACLAKAEIACCAATDAYLSLAATVAPSSVNLAAPPANNGLAYTVTVTNTDAHKDSESFELALAFPSSGGLTFGSATLTVGGTAQSAPAGSASGVSASIPKLTAGAIAQLVVNATFDPTVRKAGDSLTCVASIADYPGDHGPNVSVATAFVNQPVDGPRVVSAKLPAANVSSETLGSLLRDGIGIPFSGTMDPASAVATTGTVQGTVTLTLTDPNGGKTTLPCAIAWDSTNIILTVKAAEADKIPGGTEIRDTVTITLTAGPKGGTFTGAALRSQGDLARLDGSPATGGDVAGESGDGTQGGDFVYTITPTAGVS